MHALAPDDVVRTHAEAQGNARPPLLVTEPLEQVLDAHGLGAGLLEVAPIGEGHSNVTYLVRREGFEGVVRRPPRPPWPPSAHDVLREARVLRGLHGRARVPAVLAVCPDPAVLGAPFYVMEHVAGHVVTAALPAELDAPPERRRISPELVDALVELHAVDPRAASLEGFGRPSGYLERQLRRFSGLWEALRTRELPAVERVAAWLGAHLPDPGPARPATVVHGDFRLGNVVLAPEAPARVRAVLDWEMATIGDPLADLGYLTVLWAEPDDPTLGAFELGPVTREPGFARRAELVARYEEQSGRRAADLRWYQVLALWKAVVFMEGNVRRAQAGTTDDPYLRDFGDTVVLLAERAEALTRGA